MIVRRILPGLAALGLVLATAGCSSGPIHPLFDEPATSDDALPAYIADSVSLAETEETRRVGSLDGVDYYVVGGKDDHNYDAVCLVMTVGEDRVGAGCGSPPITLMLGDFASATLYEEVLPVDAGGTRLGEYVVVNWSHGSSDDGAGESE